MDGKIEDSTARRRAWRAEMAARRAGLDAATHGRLSAAVVAHAQSALARPQVAAFCWPVRNEPDMRPLVAAWAAAGTRLALPVVTAPDAPLAFRSWGADTPMVTDRYGIPTPAAGDLVTPDLILLPLNGFDGAGYRLGYGGGYFDRTLAALRPRPLAVGVGFEMNRLESILPGAHDQRLDWIVTEAGAVRVSAA
ncbi:MAG: 5-formyltetrahydrofolate cyclo-ligase [Betaproteobacteria bacterium]|nr:5-formyltetrahydrofolate cyclo-ligase [Betaproteobacteria bacterium]